MNAFTFTGRVGRDAELREAGGTPVLNFPVVTDTGFGDRKSTMWLNAALWGKRADSLAPMLKKGHFVAITGELSQREYEKDGQTRTSLEVRVNDLDLGPRQSSEGAAGTTSQENDEIPF